MKSGIAVFILTLLYTGLAFAQPLQYRSEKGVSEITYKIVHPLHEVEAVSRDADCIIDADASKKMISKVDVIVDVTTFDSGNSNRDSHAMEVIDALSYPEAEFHSTDVTQEGDSVKVTGALTFHGITKNIELKGTTDWSAENLTVSGKFNISLTEFEVERPSLLLVPVEDTLRFTIRQQFNLSQHS